MVVEVDKSQHTRDSGEPIFQFRARDSGEPIVQSRAKDREKLIVLN